LYAKLSIFEPKYKIKSHIQLLYFKKFNKKWPVFLIIIFVAHYNFFQSLSANEDVQKISAAAIIAVSLLLIGKALTSRLASKAQIESAIVPDQKISLFGIFDVLVGAFVNYQDSILGKENRRYLTFTATIFTTIFFCNLLGLIPGMPAPTTSIWLNVGLAFVVFVFFNLEGMRSNGVIGYLKHFCGPIVALSFIILPLELVSTCLRLLTLNLRLYWNITADHIVLSTFVDLTKLFVPCIFYLLGTFVAFMQAFIFTTLTMIYILLATQHDEEGAH
jgi:F-type H+-transporting ATPase subunit a